MTQESVIHTSMPSITKEKWLTCNGDQLRKLAQAGLIELEKKGLEFYEVDKGPFQDKVAPVYEKNAEKVGGKEVIEAVRRQ